MPAKRTSGHQVQDEATTLAQANFLNFAGAGVSAATSGGTTTITIPSGSGDWDATIIKQADETVTGSTVLQDDDELQFAIVANTIYWFEALLIYVGATAGDLKTAFDINAGTFGGGWRTHNTVTTANVAAGATMQLDNTTAFNTGSDPNQIRVLYIYGYTYADTSTTFKLLWAQAAASGSTTIKEGSLIRYRALVA